MKKLITTILAVITTITAHAQTTNTYVGTSGGNWNVATNWSQGVLPTTNDPVLINANATVNVITPSYGGDITLNGANARINVLGNPLNASNLLMTGAPGNNVRIFSDAGTINLGNGTGALSTAGGVTSWLTLNNGTSTLNLASANLTYFWLASSGAAATTTINNGSTFNNAVTILGSANGSLATLNLNGGTFNAGDMYFNYANASSTAIVNLNGGATLTAGIISRGFDGSGEAFNWNDGTIKNKSGGSLTISRGASATQNMIISLAENGTHAFNVDSGRTITVSSTATLVNKTGEQGNLQKTGSGTLIFQGSNTYTGSTSVNGGTLLVNGSLLSTNTIVSTGATLGGSGSLQTVTLNGGTVSPGNSPGLLTMTSLDASNGNFVFEIGAPTTRGVTYDAINATGLLTLGSNTTWNFNVIGNYNFQLNDTYDLFNWGTMDAATLDTNTLLTALPNLNTATTNLKWSVDNFTVDGSVSVIPEPSALTLGILGSLVLIGTRVYNRRFREK